MFVAKIQENKILEISDYKTMFPNTSFSALGINDSFYKEHGLLPVSFSKDFDYTKESLVPCDPYIEDGIVYTVKTEPNN